MNLLSALIIMVGCLEASEEMLDKLADISVSAIDRVKLIDSLQLSDVPVGWEPRKEVSETGDFIKVNLLRGDTKVAELFWSEQEPATANGGFIGKVFDEKDFVAYFSFSKGRIDAGTITDSKNYSSVFSITASQDNIFTVVSDSGFFEMIIIDGRNSRLVDRLEFAKSYYKHCVIENAIDNVRSFSDDTK